ncbi:MAG: hypothetical protein AM326_08520 [Candidatus Thorarchaeota archaeon SMTZ-45]|nr:MAG: hypothetical protein AM325_11365 [Candidatus Thorarchaeota archaeon SMTZ1-45]KXH75851.1 MAG: hypothetical protein AM326_08520 [Candidatus Thorarchaeota archaeon SMTZ-45]
MNVSDLMNASEVARWYKQSSITKGKLVLLAIGSVTWMSRPATGQLSKKELQELRRLMAVQQALDEWKRKGFNVDLPICPVCKSPRLVDLTSAHDLGIFPGSFQPAFYCIDCGWYGRIAPVMSNRPERDAVLEDLQGAFTPLMDPNEDPLLGEADEVMEDDF